MDTKVRFSSDGCDFIVERNKVFYLVSLGSNKVMKANPENSSSMFFKFGEYEPAEHVAWDVEQQIFEILERYLLSEK